MEPSQTTSWPGIKEPGRLAAPRPHNRGLAAPCPHTHTRPRPVFLLLTFPYRSSHVPHREHASIQQVCHPVESIQPTQPNPAKPSRVEPNPHVAGPPEPDTVDTVPLPATGTRRRTTTHQDE